MSRLAVKAKEAKIAALEYQVASLEADKTETPRKNDKIQKNLPPVTPSRTAPPGMMNGSLKRRRLSSPLQDAAATPSIRSERTSRNLFPRSGSGLHTPAQGKIRYKRGSMRRKETMNMRQSQPQNCTPAGENGECKYSRRALRRDQLL